MNNNWEIMVANKIRNSDTFNQNNKKLWKISGKIHGN
jgi:hypothetical protein